LREIEKDHADLLQFGDEFQGVAEVASKSKIKSSRIFFSKNKNLYFLFHS